MCEVILGRDPAAGVYLPVKAVSSRHAALELRGGRWVLRDLGGRNGTMLNGELAQRPDLDAVDLSGEIKEAMVLYGQKRATPAEPLSPPAGLAAPAALDPGAPPPVGRLRRGGTATEQDRRAVLAEHHGNVAAVGRLLGKDRVQVHRWTKRYGLDLNEHR